MTVVEMETDDQIWDVRQLCADFQDEFGGQRQYDSAAVVDLCLKIRDQGEHVNGVRAQLNCWIAYDGDMPVGYLYASCFRSPSSFRMYAEQNFWYVLPKHRGSVAAYKLAQYYVAWAKELGCEYAFMSVGHDTDAQQTQRVIELINRLGFKTQGFSAALRLG